MRRNPTITVDCPCGTVLRVRYPAEIECDCGRSWNSARIPERDIADLHDVVRQYRRNEVAFVLVALGVTVSLAMIADTAPLLIAAPAVLLAWFRWFRPWWKHRLGARLRNLPQWELRPE